MMARARVAAALIALLCCAASCSAGSEGSYGLWTAGDMGDLGDAKCNVEAVDEANSSQLQSILAELLNTTYFRLFKVNLDQKCKFWGNQVEEEPSCAGEPAGGSSGGMFGQEPWLPAPATNLVDRTLSTKEDEALQSGIAANDCDLPTFWLDMCSNIPTNSSEYLNLQLNPESWTGYNGSHIWAAIYEENCFANSRSKEEDMCYEERVLYRLLSGMHASINVHIARHYRPPRKGVRTTWEANPQRFVDLFASHPDRIKNLHFSFVVLLRAVRKAAPFLYHFPFKAGSPEEDGRAQILVQRLLDSHILQSCGPVFSAFDESLMFAEGPSSKSPSHMLKSEFKGVFHNISSTLDCITCQKCKLHGKMQLLGLGTALKILLLPEDLISTALAREEIVALFNTIGKFSQAITGVEELSRLYWDAKEKGPLLEQAAAGRGPKAGERAAAPSAAPSPSPALPSDELVDMAVGAVASLAHAGRLGAEAEDALIDRAMARDPSLLILAKHYAHLPDKFVAHALRTAGAAVPPAGPDAVVIGGGLAGLTAALTLLDRGARVVLLEKEAYLGGNSAWASSGINGVDLEAEGNPDSVAAFEADTLKSGGMDSNPLVTQLAGGSADTLAWLRGRVGLGLDKTTQLGGHSFPRTHRPSEGMAGQELVRAVEKRCKAYITSGHLEVRKRTRVTKLVLGPGGEVAGVEWRAAKGGEEGSIPTRNVVTATGGYANDHEPDSLLAKFRPDLVGFATTNTKGTTGDGIKMAVAAGAELLEGEHVQVHPTGFIDSAHPAKDTKTLAAELLRGEGGLLIDRWGRRVANELGTRDYVSGEMIKRDPEQKDFVLLLHAPVVAKADKHLPLYMSKGLIAKYETLAELVAWMKERGEVDEATVRATLEAYNAAAASGGEDEFGKKFFTNAPYPTEGPFWAGRVTPVVHYTMGGLHVDAAGAVLRADGARVEGLWAAGEVMGGLHGKNRLGGNALTECAVFGRIVGEAIDLSPAGGGAGAGAAAGPAAGPAAGAGEGAGAGAALPVLTWEEVEKHASEESCWVVLFGQVYDFTDFLEEHPAGVEAILNYGGKDGSDIFKSVHAMEMLDDFFPIGTIEASP